MPTGIVRFAAVGDLLLRPAPRGVPYHRDLALLSPAVRRTMADCDLRFGNLEFALPGDGRCVPSEPRVIGTAELVRSVASAGFNVLTLANNHMFDCLEGGFQNTRKLLSEMGIPHFGAGMDLNEAGAPAIVETHGIRAAFLAAVDERAGAFRFAGPGEWGVAPLDVDRLSESDNQ